MLALKRKEQKRSLDVVLQEGLGSDGRIIPRLIVYGATKAFLTYFTRAMMVEAKNTPVKVCRLSPGMVITDLSLPRYQKHPTEFHKSKKLLNILYDKAEVVTPYLVGQVRLWFLLLLPTYAHSPSFFSFFSGRS